MAIAGRGRTAGVRDVGARPSRTPTKPRYLSPLEMVLSLDGRWLYVMCEDSDEVRVVDVQNGNVVKTIAVGHVPRGIVAVSPTERRMYVANSWDDTVSVIDTASLKVMRTLAYGIRAQWRCRGSRRQDAVCGQSPEQRYFRRRSCRAGRKTKRLAAGRGASYLTLSPDGKLTLCARICIRRSAQHRTPPNRKITVIDTRGRWWSTASNCTTSPGYFMSRLRATASLVVAAQLRPKNLVPLAHVEHGWAFGDSLALFGDDVEGVVQVPLDELERYVAMPFASPSRPTSRSCT